MTSVSKDGKPNSIIIDGVKYIRQSKASAEKIKKYINDLDEWKRLSSIIDGADEEIRSLHQDIRYSNNNDHTRREIEDAKNTIKKANKLVRLNTIEKIQAKQKKNDEERKGYRAKIAQIEKDIKSHRRKVASLMVLINKAEVL